MLLKTWILLLVVLLTTAIALTALRNERVSKLFHEHIADRPKRRLFLAAIGFFVNFTIARSLAYANFHKLGPFHDIYIGGRHIHHLVWGILILLAVGFGWLVELGTGAEQSSIVASRLCRFSMARGLRLHWTSSRYG